MMPAKVHVFFRQSILVPDKIQGLQFFNRKAAQLATVSNYTVREVIMCAGTASVLAENTAFL